MNIRSLYLSLPIVSLMIMVVPAVGAQEQPPALSASEQKAMTVLKNMSQYLAQAERFSVTIRDGYDAVQQTGQKVEYEVTTPKGKNCTLSLTKVLRRPPRGSGYKICLGPMML